MIIKDIIKEGSQILKKVGITSHQLDVEIILSDLIGVKKEFLLTNDNIKISKKNVIKYNNAIKRRVKNEPVAYIIEKKEFWSNNFIVNKSTLIPRPETELLIYKLIDFFKNKKINILDIGTGSGCILLSILKELNSSNGIGIDISNKAIKVARKNSRKHNLFHRSKFKVSDIDKFNTGKYDLIVSTPPYIASKNLKNLSRDITDYEPINALNGGEDGLDLIKKVIYKSNQLLKEKGILAIEIGYNQYQSVSVILKKWGFKEVSKVYDYGDNVRCIISTKKSFFKI